MEKIKITVLKKTFNQELADRYCQGDVEPCPAFTEGQEFIYEHRGDGKKPDNFCDQAWNDIYKVIFTLAWNGSFTGWMKEARTAITCCTDGIRPVVFLVERIEG
jgi:uncharacterized repeat protein (TIGR04076 family)